MPINDQDRILEVLDEAECRRLLGTVGVGRLGFTDGALPAILPAPFTVDEDCVRIPTREGNWVVDAVRRSVVAFAVDSYDVVDRTGWGVTVVGPAHVATGSRDPSATGHSIVVQIGLLRGWRLRLPTAEPADGVQGTVPTARPTGAQAGAAGAAGARVRVVP